ncbi:MAG: DUF4093 domain-containing protein [Clostridia bacterium]|nr:DUF4093 domain-containing protein [Clostridia bacterium]
MLKLDRPVIVEGKFDKLKLSSILDATIITTGGFRIFNDGEKRALIRRLAEKNGIIVLTDADGAGLVIRNLLRGCVPKEKITHLYIPAVRGKERRKAAPSKEGLLGVEGIDRETLTALFAPFAADAKETGTEKIPVKKADFFAAGLSGGEGSAELRAALAKELNLPPHMSANALLEAVNLLYTKEAYESALERIGITNEEPMEPVSDPVPEV